MMADVSVLNVELYGETMGTLTRVAGDRSLFAFNEAYIENPDRPTLRYAQKLVTALIRRQFEAA